MTTYYVIGEDGKRDYYASKEQAEEAAREMGTTAKTRFDKVEPTHETDIYDLARWGKYYSDRMTWEEYKERTGRASYGSTPVEEGKAYYEVPVEASTGEKATVGMTQAVYEKYQEAKRQEAIRQAQAAIGTISTTPTTYDYRPSGQETVSTKRLIEYEKKKAEEAEVGMAWERSFFYPVQEKLGTLDTDVNAPWQARALSSTITGVGAPLAFVAPSFKDGEIEFGIPDIKETTFSYAQKYPIETLFKTAGGLVAWPIVSGRDIVGSIKAGKPGKAFGEFASVATFVGIGKGLSKIKPPKSEFFLPGEGKFKGMAAIATKTKKKPTSGLGRVLTERAKENVFRKKWERLIKKGKTKLSFSEYYEKQDALYKSKTKGAALRKEVLKEATRLYEYQASPWKEIIKFEEPKFKMPTRPPREYVFQKTFSGGKKKRRGVTIVPNIGKTQKPLKNMVKPLPKTDTSFKQISVQSKKQAQRQKQRKRELLSFKMDFNIPKGTTGIGKTPKIPKMRPIIPLKPPSSPFLKPKRGKKKKNKIFRKTKYTPSLGGAFGLKDPLKTEPKMLTGLKTRPLIRRR